MRTIGKVLPVIGLLLLTACGAVRSAEPISGDLAATLTVENQSTSDMRIYAISAGQRIRLGNVTGLTTQRLSIPARIVGLGRELAFEANPLAGQQAVTSFRLYVDPGDSIMMTIPSRVR